MCDLLRFDERGELVASSIIPIIDGGTEGMNGHVKIIVPTLSSCFECVLPLFPPPKGFPMCTIQEKPRLPEHCIAWAKLVAWDKEKPFGDSSINSDDPLHMNWLFLSASARAASFNISGVSLKLTQGVVKNIIPAVASTNAIISGLPSSDLFSPLLSSDLFSSLLSSDLFSSLFLRDMTRRGN